MTALLALPSLPLASKTWRPAKKGTCGAKEESSSDVVGHPVDEAVLDEELVVVGAVGRGHVDEAGAGVVGDEVAGEHRDLVVPMLDRGARKRMAQHEPASQLRLDVREA